MLRNPTLAFKQSLPFHQFRSRNMSVRAELAQLAVAAPDRRSLYEVLRVKRNASQVEIKTAYRTLAKLHHPDARARFMDSSIASSADGGDFIEIHNAYATLSDPNARAEYDLNLTVDSRGRWNPAGVSGYRSPGRARFYQTRRWETDQCW
ncbi:chaperone protein dnaJ 11, chloroplastic [Salvia miltiorrhiza]|uniref:chaperone protein dnaJ 11, chloroplastic n=1 Tax=Salvia miltiorrhiza TaxID=226208 RepID=UPI0025AD172C|nr:chaperone protein dnaJ 11, chloroplastic [Salvia miltiorrhiza]